MKSAAALNPAWSALCVGLALAALFGQGRAQAAPLSVGPSQMYKTPCEAIGAAKPNDVIEVGAGTYTDSCAIAVPGLILRGVGGQPKIDLSATDHPAQYKGIYVVTADDVTIENLELTGAHISADNGENAAGIRVEAKGLTVRGCKIHDNQNGILGGTSGTLTVEHSELFHNGLGDGCNTGGCTHNIYVAEIDALYFRFNWSHGIATDTEDKGHLLKSRAKANYIQYNRLTGEDGFESYELELPNGGLAVIVGNVIQKGKGAGNSVLLAWGEEGAKHPDKRVFVVNNTFVNDLDNGTFIRASGATLTAKNNLFVGKGTVSSAGALSADNLSGIEPLFVDAVHYDYHLTAGSPAIGKAVAPGMADQLALSPASEYVHPLAEAVRGSARDVGAFEYGVSAKPAPDAGGSNQDAGVIRTDAGVDALDAAEPGEPTQPAPDASVSTDAARGRDVGAGPEQDEPKSSGCSVRRARAGTRLDTWLLCVSAALLGGRRRGGRAPSRDRVKR